MGAGKPIHSILQPAPGGLRKTVHFCEPALVERSGLANRLEQSMENGGSEAERGRFRGRAGPAVVLAG